MFEKILSLRLDMIVTLLLSILFYLVLIFKRHKKNKFFKKDNKPVRDLLVATDFLYTLATSATVYGGISAVYYAIQGHLLFNQNLIISQEYIILFSGIVLFALGLLAFKTALSTIEEDK